MTCGEPPRVALEPEVVPDSFAQEVRAEAPLRQDEVVEALDVEFGAESLFGGGADFAQASVAVEIGRSLAGYAEGEALCFGGEAGRTDDIDDGVRPDHGRTSKATLLVSIPLGVVTTTLPFVAPVGTLA